MNLSKTAWRQPWRDTHPLSWTNSLHFVKLKGSLLYSLIATTSKMNLVYILTTLCPRSASPQVVYDCQVPSKILHSLLISQIHETLSQQAQFYLLDGQQYKYSSSSLQQVCYMVFNSLSQVQYDPQHSILVLTSSI